jgi:Sec-independent protein translocase protein TatA
MRGVGLPTLVLIFVAMLILFGPGMFPRGPFSR